jgi:hypothetical protein
VKNSLFTGDNAKLMPFLKLSLDSFEHYGSILLNDGLYSYSTECMNMPSL